MITIDSWKEINLEAEESCDDIKIPFHIKAVCE